MTSIGIKTSCRCNPCVVKKNRLTAHSKNGLRGIFPTGKTPYLKKRVDSYGETKKMIGIQYTLEEKYER